MEHKHTEIAILTKLNSTELSLNLEGVTPEQWEAYKTTLKFHLHEEIEKTVCREVESLLSGEYNLWTELGLMSIVDGKLIVEAEEAEEN
jgi:hypothetical protein